MSCNFLIVEDQKMPRQLLEIFIAGSGRYTLAGSITNADLAIRFCEQEKIDLILMDVLTDFGISGLDASAEIKKRFPEVKIIIVTSMPEATWLDRARSIGVDSFWYKETEKESILEVMDRTMAGEHVWPEDTPTVPIGRVTNHDFTDREIEVLRELLTGDTNTEIARRLGVTADTVKFHIASMLQKTGFHTRTELATVARSLGIVIR